jgi:hypothetical protein
MGSYTNKKGYPKTVELKSDIFGYSGNRIFKVTKDEALLISREFKLPTDFKKYGDNEDFYYFNSGHGTFHAIFWLPRSEKP